MLTIVLLPGLDGTGALFEAFASTLGRNYRVKIARYPSAEPLGYADLVEIARSSLPEDGPFVILGESFSGPIAITLAAANSLQSRCKGLVLCCSFVRNPHPVASYLKPLVGILPISAASTRMLRNILLGRFATGALRDQLANAIAQVSPSVIRSRLRNVIEVDVTAKLAALNMPLLYLRASHDYVVPRSASGFISQVKPDTRVVQLEAPHFLLQAVPDEASHVVSEFISQIEDM